MLHKLFPPSLSFLPFALCQNEHAPPLSPLSIFHYCQNNLIRDNKIFPFHSITNIACFCVCRFDFLLFIYFFFCIRKYNLQVSRHCQKYGEKKKRQYQKIGEKDCFNFEMECKFKDVFSATLKF